MSFSAITGQSRKRGRWNQKRQVTVTVSAGLARADRNNRKPGQVLALADKALYRTKEEGRYRVEKAAIWDPVEHAELSGSRGTSIMAPADAS